MSERAQGVHPHLVPRLTDTGLGATRAGTSLAGLRIGFLAPAVGALRRFALGDTLSPGGLLAASFYEVPAQ